jgi:hypothetical protein
VGGRGRDTSPFDVNEASQSDQEKFNEDEEALDELCAMGNAGTRLEFKKISKARRLGFVLSLLAIRVQKYKY